MNPPSPQILKAPEIAQSHAYGALCKYVWKKIQLLYVFVCVICMHNAFFGWWEKDFVHYFSQGDFLAEYVTTSPSHLPYWFLIGHWRHRKFSSFRGFIFISVWDKFFDLFSLVTFILETWNVDENIPSGATRMMSSHHQNRLARVTIVQVHLEILKSCNSSQLWNALGTEKGTRKRGKGATSPQNLYVKIYSKKTLKWKEWGGGDACAVIEALQQNVLQFCNSTKGGLSFTVKVFPTKSYILPSFSSFFLKHHAM